MDDLNGDGSHDRKYVDLLGKMAEKYMALPTSGLTHGGVGRYT